MIALPFVACLLEKMCAAEAAPMTFLVSLDSDTGRGAKIPVVSNGLHGSVRGPGAKSVAYLAVRSESFLESGVNLVQVQPSTCAPRGKWRTAVQ